MAETQPRTFGRYTVERELGRGGMGIVYAATHDVLGRRAAIKVLINDVSRDSELVDRFINEARAASAIQHPSIVQVFEVEHSADGVYIVMELLQGESLASRLKSRGAMPIATAIGLARQCANALEAAHRAGIVHRDLKPDNVFLVPDAEVFGGERVKLLDFGVAKLVGDGSSSVARTVTGAILGTPHYMSPEQCEGAREVDPRSDLYSLGCMVFQMVAGRLPFHSPGIGGLIGMHLHVAPPLLRSLRPDAPVELEELVSKLLAKDPEQRVQSATEVAELLLAVPAPRISSPTAPPSPALPPVEVGSATIVTISPASVDSVRVTEDVVPPSAARPRPKRRWVWPAIAVGAIVVVAIAILANRTPETPEQPSARSEPVSKSPGPPTPIDVPLENEIRNVQEPPPPPEKVVIPAPRPRPRPVAQKAEPLPAQPDPRIVAVRNARRSTELLANIRSYTSPSMVNSACMQLFYVDRDAVPWERCVAQACKVNSLAGTTMITHAPHPLQHSLKAYCPQTPLPQQAPRPQAPQPN